MTTFNPEDYATFRGIWYCKIVDVFVSPTSGELVVKVKFVKNEVDQFELHPAAWLKPASREEVRAEKRKRFRSLIKEIREI